MRKLFISLLVLVAGVGFSAEIATAEAVAVKANEITLDGKLNESCWSSAPSYTGFTQLKNNGAPANEQTSFQVAASQDGLYWAFHVADKSVKQSERPRDGAVWHDDCIEIFVTPDDPLPDDPNVRSGRHFLFNPACSQYDDSFLAGVADQRWNTDWKVAVQRTETGYDAEVFIPYYAFDFQQQSKRWRFNVGRENYTGEHLEIQVWSPCNAYLQMDKYAYLNVPAFNTERFGWRLSDLQLKMVPTATGKQSQLAGKLSGPAAGKLTLQAVARQNGRVAALNRQLVSLTEKGEALFSLPLSPKNTGEYQVTVTGRDDEGKVLFHDATLQLESVPFALEMTHPIYRKSFYADDADRTFRGTVTFSAEAALLDGVKLSVSVTDGAGKEVRAMTVAAAPSINISIDCSGLAAGEYGITLRSTGKEVLAGELRDAFSIIPAQTAGNCVRIGNNREMLLNGKPFFPRGFLGGSYEPELFEMVANSGCNVFHFYMLSRLPLDEIKRILDQAQKYNLKVIMYPFHLTGVGFFGFRENNAQETFRMSAAARERMLTMVKVVKDHPAFFAWYLYDEPRGAEYCDELRSVYRTLCEIDPHHPVIGLDCSSGGCIEKKEGFCDLHILDLYPNPRQDGTYKTPPSAVITSMRVVNNNIGNAGAWFCPQAFDGRNFDPTSDARTLNLQEIRCLVFGCVVNGATAIVPYKIGNMKFKYYENNSNAGVFYAPELKLGYLKGVLPELASLEDVLLQPKREAVTSSPKELLVMRKMLNGKDYVIAVNPENRAMQGTIKYDGCSNAYRVLGEKRSVSAKNGVIQDEFSPFAVHIYTNDSTFIEKVNLIDLQSEISAEGKH